MSRPKLSTEDRRYKRHTAIFVLLAIVCSLPIIACGVGYVYFGHILVPFDELGLPMPQEFILTRDDVPDGWEQELVERSRRYSSVTLPSANVESYVFFRDERVHGSLSHTVGVRRDPIAAARSFEDEVAYRGSLHDPLPPWQPLGDWDYVSPHADQSVLWIGIRGEPPHETLVVMSVAQYEYYVSRLWLEGDPELVTPEEVQQLVAAADAKFADLEERLGE